MQAPDLEKLRAEARDLIETLATDRDEIKVRMHLAGAELREEWDKVEARWHELEQKARMLGESASASSKDVGAAVHLLGEELAQAYRRMRRALER